MADGANGAAAVRGQAAVAANGVPASGVPATAQAGGPAAPPVKVIARAKVAPANVVAPNAGPGNVGPGNVGPGNAVPGSVGPSKLAPAGSKPKAARTAVSNRERGRRIVIGFGRYGVWAIPIFALISALAPRSSAAFSSNPQVYARYVATGRHEPRELVVLIGVAFFGVISILALGTLLARGRARWNAIAGLVFGCLGAAALLGELGTMIIRAQRLRHDLLSGNFSQMVFNPQVTGGTAVFIALGGAALLILAWFLYGVAVFRTGGLNRADGILLIISAPMLYAGGMVLNMIPVLGSFLLLAAGLGIGVSARRLVPAGQLDVAPPHYSRSAVHPRTAEQVDDFALLPAASAQPAATALAAGASAAGASAHPDASAQQEQPQTTVGSQAADRGRDSKPEKGGRRTWGRRSPTSWTVSRDRLDDETAAAPSSARANNFTGATNLKPAPAGRGSANSGAANSGTVNSGTANSGSANSGAANSGAANSGSVNGNPAKGDGGASTKTGLSAKSANSPGAGRPTRDRNSGPGGKGQPDGTKGPTAGPE